MNKKVILEVKNLRKSFDGFRAIDDISFSVEEGGILGFLGPNGSGKSRIYHSFVKSHLYLYFFRPHPISG